MPFKIYSPETKQSAIKLRQQGYSLSELSNKFNISKSTASAWSKGVWLNTDALKLLAIKARSTQSNLIYAREATKSRKLKEKAEIYKKSIELLSSMTKSIEINKLLCAFLFWAEGGKRKNGVRFINSDPTMIATFMSLLRSGFNISETKLRILMHLHDYHNPTESKIYWSKVTNIPPSQFYKDYIKPHTGKNKKEGYKGCVAIYYQDYKIALELHSIYNAYANMFIGA